ncbi:MAG: hypothetical protein LC624_10980, partial [Halobacteriales archaeon]|nr:hypothetical protein [Halobacteriales archaeon]
KLTDNLNVGKATLNVFFVDEDGNLVRAVQQGVTTPAPIPMLQSSPTKAGSTNRATAATYTADFTPGLPLSQGAGQYAFQVEASDAAGSAANQPSDGSLPAFVNLDDLFGPTIDAKLGVGGEPGQDNLDVEQHVAVNVTATITDNGDIVPGSGDNVDPATVKVSISRNGALVDTKDMPRVSGSTTQYALILDETTLTGTGSYLLEFTASDLRGQESTLTRTLNVLVNLDPVVVVTSPGAGTDGVRAIGGGIPVVFTVTDSNVNETSGILVEVASGTNGTFAPITSAVVTRVSTSVITVAVSLATEGAAQVRVTATDTLGNATSATASVLVDATPPSGVSINVDPFEITSGHAVQGASGLIIAPSAKLFVTASDAAGLGTVVVSAQPQAGGTVRNLTLTTPTQRFSLQDVLAAALDGIYVVNARATDAIGNSVTAPQATVTVDGTAPSVQQPLVAANPVTVTVDDPGAGVKSVEVLWGASASALSQSFGLSHGTGNAWTGSFPSGTTGTVFYKVRATDAVGNAAPDAQCGTGACSVVLSGVTTPPTVQLQVKVGGTPVTAGGTVRGDVSIGWTAVNAGGQSVPVTVRVTDSAGQPQTLGTDLASGPVTWDSTEAKDGTWTITATGTDGALTNSASLQVVVRNLRVASAEPIPANVPASGSFLLSFDVSHPTKKVKGVVAVLKVGSQSESVTLFDDGTHGDKSAKDGKWGASYTPRLKGTYSVDLQVTYDDNSSGTVAGVATFQAEGNGATLVNPTLVAPIAILAVLVIALGGFGIRRWK